MQQGDVIVRVGGEEVNPDCASSALSSGSPDSATQRNGPMPLQNKGLT
jgi:hypothetical protein